MSLRKPPTMTPARLAANRRNALRSTGPRTAAGKAWSRLNGLRSGARSKTYNRLWKALAWAPPFDIRRVAAKVLTPQEASHPLFASTVRQFQLVERQIAYGCRFNLLRKPPRKKTQK